MPGNSFFPEGKILKGDSLPSRRPGCFRQLSQKGWNPVFPKRVSDHRLEQYNSPVERFEFWVILMIPRLESVFPKRVSNHRLEQYSSPVERFEFLAQKGWNPVWEAS